MFTGFFSQNKYAIFASVRAAIVTVVLELFMGLMFLLMLANVQSFSLLNTVVYQEFFYFI